MFSIEIHRLSPRLNKVCITYNSKKIFKICVKFLTDELKVYEIAKLEDNSV